MPIVLKSGNLHLLETSGPVQACAGIAFTIILFSFILSKCYLAVQVHFYKIFENSGIIYLLLLTIKYIFKKKIRCLMLWFFSACVESRVIVRKEYMYLLLFAKLFLH